MHERGGKGEKGGLGSMSVRPQPPPGGAATLVRWQLEAAAEAERRSVAPSNDMACINRLEAPSHATGASVDRRLAALHAQACEQQALGGPHARISTAELMLNTLVEDMGSSAEVLSALLTEADPADVLSQVPDTTRLRSKLRAVMSALDAPVHRPR